MRYQRSETFYTFLNFFVLVLNFVFEAHAYCETDFINTNNINLFKVASNITIPGIEPGQMSQFISKLN